MYKMDPEKGPKTTTLVWAVFRLEFFKICSRPLIPEIRIKQ